MNPQPTSAMTNLSAIVSEVLADLAFMMPDVEISATDQPEADLRGDISYSGPTEGELSCWCTPGFALTLAASLLGTDPTNAEAHGDSEDAMRELLNVICGHLVTTRHGHEAVFNLSIPVVRQQSEMPPEITAGPDACRMIVAGEPVLFVHRQV
ncbi:MAG: chemotaxis protein CheX [Phycisphaerae bacterium]|nr:chemotaxis protein CheX [Phycisphaerae bacterium]